VVDGSLLDLQACALLTSLNVLSLALHPADAAIIHSLTGLRSLAVRAALLDITSSSALTQLSSLQLSACGTERDNAFLASLFRFTSLVYLNIEMHHEGVMNAQGTTNVPISEVSPVWPGLLRLPQLAELKMRCMTPHGMCRTWSVASRLCRTSVLST
jgi:hypothetical protein